MADAVPILTVAPAIGTVRPPTGAYMQPDGNWESCATRVITARFAGAAKAGAAKARANAHATTPPLALRLLPRNTQHVFQTEAQPLRQYWRSRRLIRR
jgi:hypothetical protein